MNAFVGASGVIAPLGRPNIDTDQIVPKQFLKAVSREGFGRHLFYGWMRDERGNLRKDFALNDPRYSGAVVLAAGENFGCGSSREHAVWALYDYGFRVVAAPSFADIFYSNCLKTGLLPIQLGPKEMARMLADGPIHADVDLNKQSISLDDGGSDISFEIDPHEKRILLEGLDDISLTLENESAIIRHEESHKIPPISSSG